MFFAGVISTIRAVVDGLSAASENYDWQTAAEDVTDAMSDAQRMAQPLRRRDKGFENSSPQSSPAEAKVRRAWPSLQSLLASLRQHDRESALRHGSAALEALDGRPNPE